LWWSLTRSTRCWPATAPVQPTAALRRRPDRDVTDMFDMRCRENCVEHRLTKIKHPLTTDVILDVVGMGCDPLASFGPVSRFQLQVAQLLGAQRLRGVAAAATC
jgi:hypothetical protein